MGTIFLVYGSSTYVRKCGMLTVMSISRLPTLEMHWSVNNANFALLICRIKVRSSLFFLMISCYFSNYNWSYKFYKYFLNLFSSYYIVSLLDHVYFLFLYVNIRMIATFIVIENERV